MATPDIEVTPTLIIPGAELTFRFSRSSGAGGQNVNKVNSRAELIWNVQQSEALPPGIRARFLALARRYITAGGELVIASQVHREQLRNVSRCRERLAELVTQALVPPTPRRPTKPTAGGKRRRLDAKKQRGDLKKLRNSRPGSDS